MCRFIMAEQVLGLVFEHLIAREKMHISFSRLFEIERDIDKYTRENNDAIICMSSQELYQTIETYSAFFKTEESNITLCEHYQKDKDIAIASIRRHFSETVPRDIFQTVDSRLMDILSV